MSRLCLYQGNIHLLLLLISFSFPINSLVSPALRECSFKTAVWNGMACIMRAMRDAKFYLTSRVLSQFYSRRTANVWLADSRQRKILFCAQRRRRGCRMRQPREIWLIRRLSALRTAIVNTRATKVYIAPALFHTDDDDTAETMFYYYL